MSSARSRRIRTTVAAAVAGLATAFTVAATAAPASATASTIHAKYKVTGNTFLKAPNATLPLGPGKLAANLDPSTGNLTATLTMPDATLSFKQFGLIPVTATTHFINNGPTTGTRDHGHQPARLQHPEGRQPRGYLHDPAVRELRAGHAADQPDPYRSWEHHHAHAGQGEDRVTSHSHRCFAPAEGRRMPAFRRGL